MNLQFCQYFKILIVLIVGSLSIPSYSESSNNTQLITANNNTILVLGDSLSAAFGIKEQDGWVALLQQKLQKNGYNYTIVNASISGETTGGGLARFEKLYKSYEPNVLILELGANDGLRGYPTHKAKKNLSKIIQLSLEKNIKVLLLGMEIPPNYGARYTEAFRSIYPSLQKEHNISLVPFFLEDVALNKNLMQKDGIHPTEEAQPILLKNIEPYLFRLIQSK